MKTTIVKNVAAFEKLVGLCNDLGASYNPSKAALSTTALATLLQQAQKSLEAVTVARQHYQLAVIARHESYAGIYKLASRVVRALKSSESSEEIVAAAQALLKQLRNKSKPAVEAVDGVVKKTISTANLDFVSLADTIASLVLLLQKLPSYAPNEPDLKVNALKNVLADLRSKSAAVATTTNALANARIHRNKVLTGKNGMFETGADVKEYIRSVFGVSSESAKELGKLGMA